MQRDREHVASMRATHQRLAPKDGWTTRRQRLTCCAGSGEDGRRAIALMNIAVHGHRSSNFVVALHSADRNRHVVNHAEAFAMVWESMVKSSANIYRHASFQRVFRCE